MLTEPFPFTNTSTPKRFSPQYPAAFQPSDTSMNRWRLRIVLLFPRPEVLRLDTQCHRITYRSGQLIGYTDADFGGSVVTDGAYSTSSDQLTTAVCNAMALRGFDITK
jgi:hypothetical protein